MEEKKSSEDDEKKELTLKKLEEIEKAYLDLMKAYSSCLSPLYLKKTYIDASLLKLIYSFGWDNVPGEDDEMLIRFLKDNLDIGWAENAEISKSDDETIRIIKDENSAIIKIDKKKKKATITISDVGTYDLKVRKKHGKFSINPKLKDGAWIDFQNEFYIKRWLYSDKEFYKKYGVPYHSEKLRYKSFMCCSRILNFIIYRIVRLKVRKRVDHLLEAFLLLIIAQSRDKIDPEIMKNFEIYSEDMSKLSAQFAKYSFYAMIVVVGPWLSIIVGRQFLQDSIKFLYSDITIMIIIYPFIIFVAYLISSYHISKRIFSETAVGEKERKIFALVQEYMELP